jgi:hypothetical protein
VGYALQKGRIMLPLDSLTANGTQMQYAVEVIDPPYHPLAQPFRFTLGPYPTRAEAERMARRARETNGGTETRVVER